MRWMRSVIVRYIRMRLSGVRSSDRMILGSPKRAAKASRRSQELIAIPPRPW
jgi:hypothetical protein